MLRFPTTRLSARIACTIICSIALSLLIGRRLDLPFAGGEGAGQHGSVLLEETYHLPNSSSPSASVPPLLMRGETVTTDAQTFARYTMDTCTVALAENSSLMLKDGRKGYTTFNLFTGRAVTSGDCVFTTREMKIHANGTATVIHFSWLDEIVVKVFEGSVVVSQSGTTTALTPENPAMRFSTLPSNITQKETDFSLTQNDLISSFYSWSLND